MNRPQIYANEWLKLHPYTSTTIGQLFRKPVK